MWGLIIYAVMFTFVTYLVKQLMSKQPNKIQFNSKFLIFYIVTSVTALVLTPFFIFNPKNVKNCLFAATILKHTTRLIGVTWELRNGDILAAERGAVVVANHQSTIDILGMFNIWEVMRKCATVARKELFYVWPFGVAAYLAGVVFIDRNNPKGSYDTLKITSDIMKRDKTKLWLFPEGTRNKELTGLLPFKKGAFKIAIAAQAPIIPVVYSPYYFINPKKLTFGEGHVIIKCLEPVSTQDMSEQDIPQLIEMVFERMQSTYKELSEEVFNRLPKDYSKSFN